MKNNDKNEISQIIEVIKNDKVELIENKKFELTVEKIAKYAIPKKPTQLKATDKKIGILAIPQNTDILPLFSSIQKEINGVGMGVLENGIPYLTGVGLSKMCNIDYKTLYDVSNDWENAKLKQRGKTINEILQKNGYIEQSLFIPITVNSTIHHAYPENVCLAFLEYYAFHSKPHKEMARENLILLARKTFRDFIYASVQYSPETKALNQWKYFLDRVDLNFDTVPMGYFSVFREQAGFTATLIRSKVIVNDKTIPDISVGRCWSDFWIQNNYDNKYGARQKYEHNYPDYYPQSTSNPQEPWCYPDEALAEFRKWFHTEYVASKFPKYLSDKVKQNVLSSDDKNSIIDAIKPKILN
jgi:hypothetical protein